MVTPAELVSVVRTAIDAGGYGASDVGARWSIRRAGKLTGIEMSYNGRLWSLW